MNRWHTGRGGPRVSDVISQIFQEVRLPTGQEKSAREHILQGDAAVREIMREMRERLREQDSGANNSKRHSVARRRYINRVSRDFLKLYRRKLKQDARFNLTRDQLEVRFRASAILDAVLPGRKSKWQPMLSRPTTDNVASVDLTDFSFIENPRAAMKCLREIADFECRERAGRLNFKDDKCTDVGAYLVLAEAWAPLSEVFDGGEMSEPIQQVFHATGLGEQNQMRHPAIERRRRSGQDAAPDVWAYPVQRRRPTNTSTSATQHLDQQAREKVSDRFTGWVDDCLDQSAKMELTDQGRGFVSNMIGEILCNAERHSDLLSNDGEWSVTGSMVREGEGRYRCMVAFLSVGTSIAESMQTATSEILDTMNRYAKKHARRGLSEATLRTVFALQDTITRDQDARILNQGGTGLQDVIDFACDIGWSEDQNQRPRVTIVSGNSCIQMREPYLRGRRDGEDPQAPRLQWLNSENVSKLPPDEDYAYDLPEKFAGTLVSISFMIDSLYLKGQVEDADDGND